MHVAGYETTSTKGGSRCKSEVREYTAVTALGHGALFALAVWPFGRLAVWPFGRLAVWPFGRLAGDESRQCC